MSPRSFVVFGDDWGAHPSSVQHLFRRIARTHRTVWVNTLGLRPPRLDRNDAARVRAQGARDVVRQHRRRPVTDRDRGPRPARVVSPPMSPVDAPAALRALNRVSMRATVERAARAMGLRAPVVVTTVPNGVDGAGVGGSQALVYYCVDDFTNWPGVDAGVAAAMEAELLDAAAGVIATSANLAAHATPPAAGAPRCSRTASTSRTSPAPATRAPRPSRACSNGRPVLGYLGLLDERMDVDLVARARSAAPTGTSSSSAPPTARPTRGCSRDNVRLLPAVPYGALPAVLAAFDVALLPYARNELTRSINPLKLREYLASGRPVVATSLPEVRRYAPEVRIADDVDAFVRRGRALPRRAPRPPRGARARCSRARTGTMRAERFLSMIERAVRNRVAPAGGARCV